MPTYTTIPNTQIEPEAPVTSELMTLLRDNPLSIAEDDSTAPKIKQHLRIGGTTGGNIVFSDLATYSAVEFRAYLQDVQGLSGSLTLDYSTDNGSSYTTLTTIVTVGDNEAGYAEGWFDWTTGELKYLTEGSVSSSTISGAPFSVTNLRFAASSGDKAQVIIKAFGGIS
jgi:hypothetical protein